MKYLLIIFIIVFFHNLHAQEPENFEIEYNRIQSNFPPKDSIPEYLIFCGEDCGVSNMLLQIPNLSFNDFIKKNNIEHDSILLTLEKLTLKLVVLNKILGLKWKIELSNLGKAFDELKKEFSDTFKEINEFEELAPMLAAYEKSSQTKEYKNMLNNNYIEYREVNHMTDKQFVSKVLEVKFFLLLPQHLLESYKNINFPKDDLKKK